VRTTAVGIDVVFDDLDNSALEAFETEDEDRGGTYAECGKINCHHY
jgi:hypothetical protein